MVHVVASSSDTDGSVLCVVPTLGQRPDYLVEALDSLQRQDHPGLTVVVVAPADAEHVRAETDRRGLALVVQQGSGLSGALNEGFRAHGERHEFWAWLGDDDTLTTGSVALTADFLRRHPDTSMVYGRCAYVDEAGRLLHVVRPGPLAARLMRWGPNLVPQPGSLARLPSERPGCSTRPCGTRWTSTSSFGCRTSGPCGTFRTPWPPFVGTLPRRRSRTPLLPKLRRARFEPAPGPVDGREDPCSSRSPGSRDAFCTGCNGGTEHAGPGGHQRKRDPAFNPALRPTSRRTGRTMASPLGRRGASSPELPA